MKERLKTLVALLLVALFPKPHVIAQTRPVEMVLAPAGTFTIGSPSNEGGRDQDEGPQHPVTMSEGFYMSATEITKSQWDAVRTWGVGHGYTDLPIGRNGYKDNAGGEHPVTEVSWLDALKWCNARSELEKRVPLYTMIDGKAWRTGSIEGIGYTWNGNGYRLPTEAEWEYACRARTTTAFSTGPISVLGFECSPIDTHLDRAGWYCGNSDKNTHPVGQKQPNAWGLYDMHGNVWEWTGSFYGPYSSSPETNPLGASGGNRILLRGGSFDNHPQDCRAAYRFVGPSALANNLIGFRIVLPMAGSGEMEKLGMSVPPPIYGACPEKQNGKTGLVVVMHGWMPPWETPEAPWVGDMTNAISSYLTAHGLNNWQVHGHMWPGKAHTALWNVLDAAEEEGVNLGNCIVTQRWTDVHLIGHSAGAAGIEAATKAIKSQKPSTIVHATFLDAYVGALYGGRGKYGEKADWSDSYFSHDFETSGEIFPFTEGPLDYAYNVNVTMLNKVERRVNVYRSSLDPIIECEMILTSHQWPYEFYMRTILESWPEASGFGFPLSGEVGGLSVAINQYPVGKNTLKVLGTPAAPCDVFLNESTPSMINPLMGFEGLTLTMSPTGVVEARNRGLILIPRSPVWVATMVTTTNTVNFLTLEAAFIGSQKGEGLLTIYWGTNTLGSIDERVASPGLRQYTFPLPEVATNGMTRMLGFRLDPFSTVLSSATITNVALGFRGIQEPFSLSFTGQLKDGIPILQLTGPKGITYAVESSTNLTDWKAVAMLINTDGTVRFTDPNTSNATAVFYRAVAP
ncbi:MAG: SUMF1/EgtB/PvdO family nonheme iron enzyme [Candidatus Liptonbacteria bacterium]|nr:SUMF1/EgtB/PvdO family nonheme iron enzyme [Candidatus Liptonbacteria bacterium]